MAKKKAPKPKKPSKKYSHYQISGDKLERKLRSCPKCGPGIFLAKHTNRIVCGTCHYTEFIISKEKDEKAAENKPSEKKSDNKK